MATTRWLVPCQAPCQQLFLPTLAFKATDFCQLLKDAIDPDPDLPDLLLAAAAAAAPDGRHHLHAPLEAQQACVRGPLVWARQVGDGPASDGQPVNGGYRSPFTAILDSRGNPAESLNKNAFIGTAERQRLSMVSGWPPDCSLLRGLASYSKDPVLGLHHPLTCIGI
eukprot:147727-Chlamydomonas_euryale.AAC.2